VRRGWAIALLGLAACGPQTALWIRVEAPLLVPDDCDALQLSVTRPDGSSAFAKSYDLSQGPSFPLTLSLSADTNADVGVALNVEAQALKAGALARTWAARTTQVTLVRGQLTSMVVPICECP
jgi:hypothetical protein